jgi:hypothetical protein
MAAKEHESPKTSQSDRFKAAARELGCDEDEARFEASLKKVAGHKPEAKAASPKRSAEREKSEKS